MLTVVFVFIMFYRVMMQVASIIVISSGKLNGVVAMSVVEALLNLVLSIVLVRYYGILGVAFGTALAGVLTSGWYVIWFTSRELRMSVFEYLARGLVPPLLCAVPAAALAFALLRFYPVTSWLRLFLEAGAVGSIYALAYLIIGLNSEERSELFGRLKGFYHSIGARRRVATT